LAGEAVSALEKTGGAILVHLKYEALQVFGLGQIEDDGMIGCGAATLQEANAAVRVGGSGGDSGFEVGERDVMGAGAGNEQAAGAKHLQGSQVEFLVAAQRAFDGTFAFGEGRRVENDGVELFAGTGPVAQDLKGIAFDPVHLSGDLRAIRDEIAFSDFERRTGGVDACDAL